MIIGVVNWMTERMISSDDVREISSMYLKGDLDPKNFSYVTPITRVELLNLFLRNGKIQKACVWFAGEVLRERWEFHKKQKVKSTKHGEKYVFKQFILWLEWNGFMQEVLKALFWSLLFGEAIIVFYDGQENKASVREGTTYPHFKKIKPTKGNKGAIKCKAFYELCKGNGYTIEDQDKFFGIPTLYKIKLHPNKSKKDIVYYVDSARVVRFPAMQKELKYGGSSSVGTIAKDCIAQEQIKRSVVTSMNMLCGGIMALRADNADGKEKIKESIGDSLSHLRRVYIMGDMDFDQLIKLIIPDFKIDQIKDMNDIIQTDISTGIDMSKSNLEGAPQGALSSAEYDTLNTYSKVKQLQAHFKRAMEECFFMFGKKDTSFDWNDPTPKIGKLAGNTKPVNDKEDENNKNIEDDKNESENENENADADSNESDTSDASNETTS